MSNRNALGQPIGFDVPGWSAPPRPPRTAMEGRYAAVEPIDADRHAADLFAANSEDEEGRMWTYMPYGPFTTLAEYRAWIEKACLGDDPLFHAIRDKRTGRAGGVASYLRIDPPVGVIEIGHIALSPSFQDHAASTDAMYLMMARVFDELGYRRYEWKCDALNEPSRRAAERLGFTFEGIFRQATMYKGRNRDTAWYAVIDKEWPALKGAYLTWLDPANFDADGRQRQSLRSLTAAALGGRAAPG
jgi:RimJ/RimL family protein N-acetyltransferase